MGDDQWGWLPWQWGLPSTWTIRKSRTFFACVLDTADGGLCHLNFYTALQCSWHSNIRSGFPGTRHSCISSLSAAIEGAESLQGIGAPVLPSGGGFQQCILGRAGSGTICPQTGEGPACYIIFFPYSLGIWSQTKSTQLSLKLLTKNQSKYMKASMQWLHLTTKTFIV